LTPLTDCKIISSVGLSFCSQWH